MAAGETSCRYPAAKTPTYTPRRRKRRLPVPKSRAVVRTALCQWREMLKKKEFVRERRGKRREAYLKKRTMAKIAISKRKHIP